MFKRCCYLLFIIEALLGIAHLLWPEYRWGQGRHSYFNFNNSLTLVSWLASMQLVGLTILALVGFHRETHDQNAQTSRTSWIWLLGALLALVLSIGEITRFHIALKLLGYPNPNIYEQFVIYSLWLCLLALFGWFLFHRVRNAIGAYKFVVGWLVSWGLNLFLTILYNSTPLIPKSWHLGFTLATGLAYLCGCTLLLLAIGGYVLRSNKESHSNSNVITLQKSKVVLFLERTNRLWIFLGVGGMTFTIIFLQIILFRMITIFGDYLTAYSVISIALLGISVGGLIGWRTSQQAPLQTMIGASLMLPVSILLAFGTTVSLMNTPLFASILLMIPFVCASAVITIALIRIKSHLVYAIDLIGAAIGALVVNVALSHLREEGSLFFLAGFTFVLSGCFINYLSVRRIRTLLLLLILGGSLGFLAIGYINLQSDWLNIVRTKILQRYPNAEVLFSSSSFVGRYDVVRRKPGHKSVSTYNNGRIIDNIRRRPTEQYQIDPRVPHTLMKDAVILILGLSGDGISKTSKALGKKVYGVEINPAVVNLQRNELVEYNSNSYKDIEVSVMDGRSFVEQSDQCYDIITLMNAHSARGRTAGRAPSPEYLHTREAISSYVKHLTERGVIIVEEPVSRPRREPPVWKLLLTMRQALIDLGSKQPENHFFVFQWRTKRNNYIQILMKKNPFTKEDTANLKKWLNDVDNIKKIETSMGRRMGPIRAKTTILYSPDEFFSTNYSRIIRGGVDEDFLNARNLCVTTDDRPFHFDINPYHPEIKSAYMRTLLMILLLIPFLIFFLARYRYEMRSILPYLFIVALTGLGYLLIEVVLIQRYEIFLGSPVITFSTILGTLLVFSGLGSLWSGRIGQLGVYSSLGIIIVLLMLHQWFLPSLFPMGTSLFSYWKVTLAVISIAPLAFFMGIPFPFVLRTGKIRFSESAVGMLFAINAATSALAVPLTMNISTSYGLNATFQSGIIVYITVVILLISIYKQKIQVIANGFAIIILGLLLISPWAFSRPTLSFSDTSGLYRVYGVSYGKSFRRENKVIRGGSPSKSMPFEWYFWIIRGNGRTILVDTGFDDPKMAKKRSIFNYVRPIDRLRQLGISPSDDVSDIILTHAHWDHMGSLAPYKKARIWIQEKEYEYAKSITNPNKPRTKGLSWQDLKTVMLAEKEGRLHLVNGEKTLLPGITMILDGSHTPGHQYVTVDSLDGPVIIAGDSNYMYKNNRWHKPIASAVNHGTNLATIREMHRRAASPFLILPGHDPLVMKFFPQVSEGIVQITTVPE